MYVGVMAAVQTAPPVYMIEVMNDSGEQDVCGLFRWCMLRRVPHGCRVYGFRRPHVQNVCGLLRWYRLSRVPLYRVYGFMEVAAVMQSATCIECLWIMEMVSAEQSATFI